MAPVARIRRAARRAPAAHAPFKEPRLKTLVSLLLAALVAGCGGSGSDTGTPAASLPPISTTRADASAQADRPDVDAYLQSELAAQHIPGASLAVMHDGQIVYAKSYGYADIVAPAPMRLELRFPLASISKQFVATAVLMLVDEGRLGLDDKLAAYLGSDGPPGWNDITLRQVLSHTAGLPPLPDQGFFDGIDAPGATTEAAMLARFRTYPLLFPPGTAWSYSNVGYDLLGFVVSRVTGAFYGDFIEQRIFAPLGMASARMLRSTDTLQGTANGYTLAHGAWQPLQIDPAAVDYLSTGASGIQMSALDLAKWDAALGAGILLSPQSQALMWTPAPAAIVTPGSYDWGSAYGFGWFLATLSNGQHVASHSGGLPGYCHEFIRYRDTKWSVVVLTNLDENQADPKPIAQEVGRLFGATP
jgi:D-alanyl-D-alanine carboxypeptidase